MPIISPSCGSLMGVRMIFRKLRGWMYRHYPAIGTAFRKKLAGYERGFDLESSGFTKEGFFHIFQRQILVGSFPGRFVELAAGDGWVGSLGAWLEGLEGWTVEAWEHRSVPRDTFRQHRPRTELHSGRLTDWSPHEPVTKPLGITTRGVREAAGVCRAIRRGLIRPRFVGIWNPSRRPVWYRRLDLEGYRLGLVWHNMEFYREVRGRESGLRGQESGG